MKSRDFALTEYSLISRRVVALAFFVVWCTSASTIASSDPDDIYWAAGFDQLGVDGEVYTFTTYDGNLIAAGQFQVAGSVMAANIAMWDGNTWWPLGSGLSQPGPGGDNSVVYALAVYDNKLVAAGEFSQAGSATADNIAIWDGANWSALGSGVDDTVRALTVFGSNLIAGGQFQSAGGNPAAYIASWDGSAWTALGSGLKSRVGALTVFQGHLIAGTGECYLEIEPCPGGGVWSWDGNQWSQLGQAQFRFAVSALTVFQDKLIAGYRTDIGIAWHLEGGIAAWDGSNWSFPPGPVEPFDEDPAGAVEGMAIFNDLLVVTSWDLDLGFGKGYVHTWDGTIWTELYNNWLEEVDPPLAVTVYADELLVARIDRWSIARWVSPTWLPLGFGIEGPAVNTLQPFDSKLIVGGDFESYLDGNLVGQDIASWDEVSWTGLAAGGVKLLNGTGGLVRAATVDGDNLVASGQFADVGGTAANHVASWNGSAWNPVGNLDYNTYFLGAYGLTSHNDHLFTVLFGGSSSTRHIMEWNGTSWTVLNPGLLFYGPPAALTVYGNEVIVGGLGFGGRGCAASWDGVSWTQLGSGAAPQGFRAMVEYQGELVAGGSFTTIGGVNASGVAMWDGGNWSPLGAGVKGTIRSLLVWNGFLVAGGVFDTAGGRAAANIAAWNGQEWSSFGSGTSGPVNALAEYGGSLFAGGEFTSAGGKVSAYLAKWTGTTPSDCCKGTRGNLDGDLGDLTDGSDLQAYVDYVIFNIVPSSVCPLESDVAGDGITDASDLQALVDYIFFGMDTVLPCP